MYNCMFLRLLLLIYARFVVKNRKLGHIYFVNAKLLTLSGMMHLIRFQQDFVLTSLRITFTSCLGLLHNMLIINKST